MKTKRESYFWTGYSDLMTSLFFVMLVLAALAIAILSVKQNELQNSNEDLKKSLAEAVRLRNEADSLRKIAEGKLADAERLLQIDKQFKPLIESGSFEYNEKGRKFIAKAFKGKSIFHPDRAVILPQFIGEVDNIGHELDNLLRNLYEQDTAKMFSYMLVIEGNVAKYPNHPYGNDFPWGYRLSYDRALAVYNRWRQINIDLRKYNTEVMICGSGFNGLDRDPKEENNKRFVIQILPKIRKPEPQ